MRRFNEDWERKKSYLIRSLFNDVPLLSPVAEESDSDDLPRPRSLVAYRAHSPLPPLIIEREPNRHDHPEEFYQALAVKIRRLYKQTFFEGEVFSDSDDLDIYVDNINVNNDSVTDSNIGSTNGYSGDYESYESVEPASNTRNYSNNIHGEHNVSNTSHNDVDNGIIDEPDENNNSKTRESANGVDEEDSDETEMETNLLTVAKGFEEDVFDTDNTEEQSGSNYRQITTQAVIHVDGTQVETQSFIYEGSERSIVLMSRGLCRVQAEEKRVSVVPEEGGSEKSMAEEETVALEVNADPGDIEMPFIEPEGIEADVREVEVMRTPNPKVSVDSMIHVTHNQSDVTGEYDATHRASVLTSENDVTKPTTPDFPEDRRKLGESSDTLGHESPILNVDRNMKRFEDEFTSDMDITSPVCHINVSFLNKDVTGGDLDRDVTEMSFDNLVSVPEPLLTFGNKDENNGREAETNRSDTQIPRLDAVVLNEGMNMNVERDKEEITDMLISEDRGRKRKGEMSVQTTTQRVSWEDLKENLFVGTPKIFRLCSCREHVCD